GDGVITTDRDNNISYLNPVAETLTGWSMKEAVGCPLFEVLKIVDFHTGEPMELLQVNDTYAGKPIFEGRLVRQDRTEVDVQKTVAKIRDSNNYVIGLVIVVRDVTENRKLTKRLSYEATHDSLTGLVNRSAFEDRVTAAVQQSKDDHCTHCLCYLDLDQFKVVNDTCGHAAGDELLRIVSKVIHKSMRKTDVLARLGGDEFGILLTQCSMPSALALAETIRKQIHKSRFVYDHQNFPTAVSIGVVEITDSDNSIGDIFKAADSACYMAKERGRNLVHAYRPTDEHIAMRESEVRWVSRLHTALEEDLFTLHVQPIIPLNTRDFSAAHYELLLRLKGDDQTLIYPDTFLPAAARYNLLPAIDRWVFAKAIDWLNKNRPLLEGGRISINLTGPTLSEDSFLEFIQALFRVNGMCADAMIIEITESSALSDLHCAQKFMAALGKMGCKFALDDFGKGFSSLSSLKHLAVDYIKIDGGFVRDMLTDPVDEAMVKTINDIGHSMDKIVVAEFVENDAIQSRLTELGVDFGQGFGISRPYPLDDFNVNKTE
ncbi:MAG: Amt family ammonium transporter, partial [Gammaproteobacteria bacterium]